MTNKKKLLMKAIGVALISCASTVQAANWLMLQGTEPAGQSARAKVWGFVQPEYQTTDGTELKAGPWSGQEAIFNQIGPDLKTDTQFSIRRARIGVRGTGFPLDSKVNYFILAEFGNNGITRAGGQDGGAKLTDASVTLNHIPGARIRVGQFKTPGAEEGLQAIHVFDYVNFTNVTNGLLLERYFDGDGSDTFVTPGGNSGAGGDPNAPNGSVGAFRDVGIQLFNTFKVGKWEHSYAAMYGNGNGIDRGDNDDNKDTHLYLSTEWVFGGKGGRREGWKMFVWNQDGKRTLTTADAHGEGTYDRTRSGLGTTFRKGKIRAAFEYITADGMIFNGTDGGAVAGSAANGPGTTASFNVETKGEADGYYAHFGYAVLPNVELDIRYDIYNRMTDVSAKERKFDTATLGAQYFFNKKTRATLNYESREGEAPNLAGDSNPTKILDGIDDRLSLQLIAIF
jgi:hypothetical protein